MTGTTVGKMAEVFPSIQGEGYQVGVMQLFLRLAGCNLKCPSCDTPHSWESEERFSLWPWPGRKAVQMANPVSPGELFETLGKAYPLRDFHSISFTGGEPLHQPDFVRELGLLFFHNGNRISMQTNGTLPDAISGLNAASTIKRAPFSGAEIKAFQRKRSGAARRRVMPVAYTPGCWLMSVTELPVRRARPQVQAVSASLEFAYSAAPE